MNRVFFLGIDGLDWRYIQRHLDRLPNFRRLDESGLLRPLPSIFPPDSIPAWITIFTGQPPDAHGVVESIDYLAKNPASAAERAPSFLRGRTFWDVVSASGGRVLVVNPFMAYPSWPLNGAMISGPVFVGDAEPSIEPFDATDELELPQLGGIVDFPTDRTMHEFVERALSVTEEQAVFGLQMLDRVAPDLFFMNILTIDRVQHFLWRFCDPDDPTYPGVSDLGDAILRAYELTDDIVGRYLERVGDGGLLVVASDHGHGMRPPLMLYVDEVLRREGLFKTGGFRHTAKTLALEKMKRAVLGAAYRFGREHEAYALARRLPGRRALKTSAYAGSSGSSASVSSVLGRNSSGGVDISGAIVGQARREMASRITALMLSLRDGNGERVCEWACPREDLFQGPEAVKLPDVLFRLREDVGVDFGVFGPVMGPDTMHRRVSGGHLPSGIFAASSRELPFVPERLDQLHDFVIAATLGVKTA